MKIEWATKTDRGRIRPENEDFVRADPELNLVVLCDGMGGHRAGEVASRIAVETFFDAIAAGNWRGRCPEAPDAPSNVHALVHATWASNDAIFTEAESREEFRGMGCTLVAVLITENTVSFVTVGDSRLYLLRDGTLHRISQDHTRLRMLQQMGIRLDPTEARQIHGMLVRALGTQETVEVDFGHGPARTGDLWLLCSDGLTDELDDAQIKKVLEKSRDVASAASECVRLAVEAGGRDNITVAIARVVEGDDSAPDHEIPRPETCSPFSTEEQPEPDEARGFISRLSRRLRGGGGEPHRDDSTDSR
jgi:protein phosphatase